MDKLIITSSPHVRSKTTISSIMADVLLALMPATALGIYYFGISSALLIATTIVSAVIFEAMVQKVRKKPVTVNDLSAVVTGLILALNLPPGIPLWIAVVGAAFAIIIVKQLFGGLGQNFMNPAMAARVFLVISYPKIMSVYFEPVTQAVSTATPLALIKAGQFSNLPPLMNAFIGKTSGSIGETSALALLVGGAYLIYRKVISWEIPVIYIGTTFLLTFLLGGMNFYGSLYSILSGGLLLGGIYMLTDYSSSPVTRQGKMIFAFGAGVLTTLIRLFGGYPEGVMFSILLMNVATPLIEHFSVPKIFGGAKK
ncbi:MAG: RnfABCDGE type electron transport complex subunit D [Tissierellia bacterium]|jgi:electron transport complex protein RnfD|nr:RnfABCDGE type electron transport complex subunit D [Tissierellia bacterium]